MKQLIKDILPALKTLQLGAIESSPPLGWISDKRVRGFTSNENQCAKELLLNLRFTEGEDLSRIVECMMAKIERQNKKQKRK